MFFQNVNIFLEYFELETIYMYKLYVNGKKSYINTKTVR